MLVNLKILNLNICLCLHLGNFIKFSLCSAQLHGYNREQNLAFSFLAERVFMACNTENP